MNFMYLTDDDLETLRQKYPSAYYFLLHQTLLKEREILRIELTGKFTNPQRKAWIMNRLWELDWCLAGSDEEFSALSSEAKEDKEYDNSLQDD